EADQDAAREAHAQVVEQRADGTEDGARDGVQHGDHEREQHDLTEAEGVGDRELVLTEDVAQEVVDRAEDSGRVEHDPHENRCDDEHDAEAQPDEEAELHHRPEVEVDEPEAHLLAACVAALFALELLGDAAHDSVSSFPAAPGVDASVFCSSEPSGSASSESGEARLRSLLRAIWMMRSSSASWANFTPMVFRPFAGTSATADLITLPLARTARTSSSSSTMSAPASSPRASVSLATRMP